MRTSDSNVYCVFKAGTGGMRDLHYVHVLEHICSNCVILQQYGMICRHQLAVIRYLRDTSGSKRGDWDEICSITKHFHLAYRTDRTSLIDNLNSIITPQTENHIPELDVRPAPLDKHGGRKKGS